MPIEHTIWELIFKTGWTLEYVDSLSVASLHEYLNVMDANGRINGSILNER